MSPPNARRAVRLLGVFGLLGALVTASPRARADVVLSTEIMIGEIGTDVTMLGYDRGIDPTATLSFTSFVDPSGSSFQYATVPGTTYQGQSFSLTGTGTVDANGVYAVSATFNFGGIVSTLAGDETTKQEDDGSTSETSNEDERDKNGNKTGDSHTFTSYKNNKSTKFFDHTDANGKIDKSSISNDSYNPDTGEWIDTGLPDVLFDPHPLPGYTAIGFSPLAGGEGSFTTVLFVATPEPSTLSLVLVALAGLGFPRVWRRFLRA